MTASIPLQEYIFKGYLPGGPFYDSRGNPTAMLREVVDGAKEAERLEAIRKANEKQHPPCNTKWTAKTGGEVPLKPLHLLSPLSLGSACLPRPLPCCLSMCHATYHGPGM